MTTTVDESSENSCARMLRLVMTKVWRLRAQKLGCWVANPANEIPERRLGHLDLDSGPSNGASFHMRNSLFFPRTSRDIVLLAGVSR